MFENKAELVQFIKFVGLGVGLLLLALPSRAVTWVRRWVWVMVVVLIVGFGVTTIWRDAVDMDEVQHLHASWLLTQGHQPFSLDKGGFFEHHTPLYWRTAGRLVHWLCPEPTVSIFAVARSVAVLIILGTVGGLLWLARELKVQPTVGLSVVLVANWLHPAFEFRPDGLALFFSVVSVAALARAVRLDRPWWGVLSGVAFSLAVGLIVKVWPLMVVWAMVMGWLAVKHRWRLTLVSVAGASVGGLAVLADALWVADWSDMWTALVETNAARQVVVAATEGKSWWYYVDYMIDRCPAIVVMAVVSVVAMIHARGRVRDRVMVLSVVAFAVSVVTFVVQQRPNPHYLLIPVLATAIGLMVMDRRLVSLGTKSEMGSWLGMGIMVAACGASAILLVAQRRALKNSMVPWFVPDAIKDSWMDPYYIFVPMLVAAIGLMVRDCMSRVSSIKSVVAYWYGKVVLTAVLGTAVSFSLMYGYVLAGPKAASRKGYEAIFSELIRNIEPGQKVIAPIPLHPIWAFDSKGWFCPQIMRQAGGELGLWPGEEAAFGHWLAEDPPDAIVLPLRTKGRRTGAWNESVLTQLSFRRWVKQAGYGFLAKGNGVLVFRNRQYCVLVRKDR